MKRTFIVIALLLLSLCLVPASAEDEFSLGQPFPDFTVTDTEGNVFTLSEALKDHEAVLINFWAAWYWPCEDEIPFLNEAYEQYGDRVAFISLSIEDDILEGPRGVRLGDAFHEDYQRFRSEMNGVDENMFEVLYGAENEVPRGTAEYGGLDGITLRYVTAAADGREAELMLRYTLSVLSEIILVIR